MSNPFVNPDVAGTSAVSGKQGNMKAAPVKDVATTNWDWQNSYIETDHTHMASLAAQPDSTLFLVGPSRLNAGAQDESGSSLSPVGYVQGINGQQQRAVQRLHDFGSARAFFTVGKVQGSLQLSRLFFKGTSLLASLYTYAMKNGGGAGDADANSFNESIFNKNSYVDPNNGDMEGGSGAFFIDIGSELFLNPFGCAVIYRSKAGHAIGGIYFEMCMFDTHSIQMDPSSPQMMENVNIQFDRAVPMALTDELSKSS